MGPDGERFGDLAGRVWAQLVRLGARRIADPLGAGVACHCRVPQVEIRDDTGAWNVDRDYPDGRYLGAGALPLGR